MAAAEQPLQDGAKSCVMAGNQKFHRQSKSLECQCNEFNEEPTTDCLAAKGILKEWTHKRIFAELWRMRIRGGVRHFEDADHANNLCPIVYNVRPEQPWISDLKSVDTIRCDVVSTS